ncbi:MAG: hypothetical protein JRJ86_24165 [Deltaproteobacteria bacterium]|nr:hypothetical protein [Deltaproteobacteria bacterium]MBW2050190.1 hypothetical protein [Deltaproteobacteria bacterium]
MPEPTETPHVTMANTKKEMLEAYQAIKDRLKARDKELLNAQKARKQMEKQLAAATADAEASQDPLQRLHDLRGAFSRELADLAERFEREIDTYRKIQSAVQTKQEELKTIYEVETAASDLAALIEAQQAKKEHFEQEMESRKTAFEEEMREARTRWDKEKIQREQEAKEQAQLIKKQRQREQEEFEYAFTREREQRRNELEDELQAVKKEVQERQKDFEQTVEQRKAELDSREEAIARQEGEMEALRKQVETFPEKLEGSVKKAEDAIRERLTSDFDKTRALIEARFEGEKNVLKSKIESLEKLVKVQATQITELSRKHEQAYEKVQDIANRAVAAAKKEIITVPAAAQSTQTQGEDRSG